MSRLWASLLIALSGVTVVLPPTPAAADSSCIVRQGHTCGGLTGDSRDGEFHGLIMVRGEPGVLDAAASSGDQPGCADCEWTLVLACLDNSPNNPGNDLGCQAGQAGQSGQCPRGELPFRLFLSTTTTGFHLIQVVCLGGSSKVIPIGAIAAADVDRYLRDVRPPDLVIRMQPPGGAIAGLATYFMVRPPSDLRPAPFGGTAVTEAITITPVEYLWRWGDGSSSGWTTDAGAPYPTGTLTHTYAAAGRIHGSLTARWGGRYTITVDGQTLGPYDAVGTVTHTQPFALPVAAAHTHLVSHG